MHVNACWLESTIACMSLAVSKAIDATICPSEGQLESRSGFGNA